MDEIFKLMWVLESEAACTRTRNFKRAESAYFELIKPKNIVFLGESWRERIDKLYAKILAEQLA